METQRMEYERFINELLDKQQECFKQMHVEDMKKMEDKMREYNLSMENTIRQKDANISELENDTMEIIKGIIGKRKLFKPFKKTPQA